MRSSRRAITGPPSEPKGEAAGKAAAILAVLGARGVPVSDEARAHIEVCGDVATLDRWIARAATAPSTGEVFSVASGRIRSAWSAGCIWPPPPPLLPTCSTSRVEHHRPRASPRELALGSLPRAAFSTPKPSAGSRQRPDRGSFAWRRGRVVAIHRGHTGARRAPHMGLQLATGTSPPRKNALHIARTCLRPPRWHTGDARRPFCDFPALQTAPRPEDRR